MATKSIGISSIKQAGYKHGLVVFVGENTVRGFIVSYDIGNLISETKLQISISSNKGKVLEALKKVLEHLGREMQNSAKKEGRIIKVENAKVILSYPWFKFEEQIKIENFEKTTVITASHVKENLNKLIKSFRPENDLNIEDNNLKILDIYTSEVKMNGYLIENPIGKKSKNLETKYAISFTQKNILEDFKKVITDYTNIKDIKFVSLNRAASIYIMHKDKQSGIFIYPERRLTYIGKINRDGKSNSAELEHGTEDIISAFDANSKESKDLAISKLNMILDDILEEKDQQTKIINLLKEWSDDFKIIMGKLNISSSKFESYCICDDIFFKFIDRAIKDSLNLKNNTRIDLNEIINTLALYQLE